MVIKMRAWRVPVLALALSAASIVPSVAAESTTHDNDIQSELVKSLNDKRFKDIQTVQGHPDNGAWWRCVAGWNGGSLRRQG